MLDENLANLVRQKENIKEIFDDSVIALKLFEYDNHYYKSKCKSTKKFIEIASKLFIDYSITKHSHLALLLSTYILQFAKIGINLNYLNFHACKILINYLNNVKVLEEYVGDNYNFHILNYLIGSINEIEVINILKEHKYQLTLISYSKSKELQKSVNPNPQKKIKEENLLYKNFYNTINENFYDIQYFKSNYYTRKVIIKKYLLLSDISQETKESLMKIFQKEAKCNEILKNTICNYQGFIQSKNSFSLVIEDNGITLHEFLKKNRTSRVIRNHLHGNWDKMKTIYYLIQYFAFAAEKNIQHRWICPSSLIINENHIIKVTDFIFASIKTGDFWDSTEKTLLPKFPEFYRSPEEENFQGEKLDLEKCDVYSLGLVILEIICLEEISKIKQSLDFYLNQVKEYNQGSIYELLKNMLCERPQDRLSLREISYLNFYKSYED